MRIVNIITLSMLLAVTGRVAAGSDTAPTVNQDAYISGYVSAGLQIKFHLQHAQVVVHAGQVKIADVPVSRENDIRRFVRNIKGVRTVVFTPTVKIPQKVPTAAATNVSSTPILGKNLGTMPPVQAQYANPSSENYRIGMDTRAMERANVYHLPTGFLPPGRLFQPLLADPKWPVFSVSYTHYSPYHPNGLKDVIPVSIGDTIPFERGDGPDQWQWEAGMQADAFAYFNMDTTHADLQNTDFMVGGYLAVRRRNISFLVRYYHQSSHLGDEFLIANPAYYYGLRQKISYEELNALASIDLWHRMIRLYAGAGYLGDVAPSNLGHWRFHYGVEYHGPFFFHKGSCYMAPVAGLDFKNWNENNYDTDISAVGGIQLTNGKPDSSKLQLLLEYYHGHSPYGQFFVNEIQYLGVGVHFYF
ncbi:MAG: DUF1207 domain-containing protein [Phycisphaerae bacterium]